MNNDIRKAVVDVISKHQPNGVKYNDLLLLVHDEMNQGDKDYSLTQEQIINEVEELMKQKLIKGPMEQGGYLTF